MPLLKFHRSTPDWSFQNNAVDIVVAKYRVSPRGRFLLVVPTGGGKTLTAFKIINKFLQTGVIQPGDKVLWVVHTLALRKHAQDALSNDTLFKRFDFMPEIRSIISVQMKAEAMRLVHEDSRFALIVIDEAHHTAAQSYAGFFDTGLAVFGLTATPTRMDARALPFDSIAYGITFRELVHRRVVLLPRFLPEVKTNLIINASALDDPEQLERFNTEERNSLVSDIILREAETHRFQKVIVFAGTNAHVERLYEALRVRNRERGSLFPHVGYIYGGDINERGISNDDYLTWHKSLPSSILVNCRILNEGYDDPHLDTVVMATPTNSILYYMQCIGRVVRNPENVSNARAYVVEIADRLPNVTYRIDNRWLFAEISDYLEPDVRDVCAPRLLRGWLLLTRLLFSHPAVRHTRTRTRLWATLADLSPCEKVALLRGERINILLFNDVPDERIGRWRILTIPEGDIDKMRFFNTWSENIDEYYSGNYEDRLSKDFPELLRAPPMTSRPYRTSLVAALHRASMRKARNLKVDSLIYYSFR